MDSFPDCPHLVSAFCVCTFGLFIIYIFVSAVVAAAATSINTGGSGAALVFEPNSPVSVEGGHGGRQGYVEDLPMVPRRIN